MVRLTDIVKAFLKGITRSRVSLIGAMLTTAVFPLLLGAILIDLLGWIENPYFGAVIYMVMGPAFILGLVLVFLGLFFFKGKEEVGLFTLEYLREHFTDPTRFNRLRKLVFLAVFLTMVNLFIIGLLGYSGYHYMESVGFCGQFCHTVMNPEYTAYKNSPHSRVPCVECHIGAGATWFVKSKISGARQLYAVAFDTYSRPIETPVHNLRPARDTCEECHRPEKFVGNKLVVKDKFLPDEQTTHVQTVLLLKVGSAGDRTVSPHGVHWHVAPENRITYKAADRARMAIPEVTLARADGTQLVFRTEDAEEALQKAGADAEEREMDCIDCHNRPTHIYLSPDRALDNKILSGAIPRELPFIKKMALELVTRKYASQEEARRAIASELTGWYQKNYPGLMQEKGAAVAQAIAGIQAAYAENVFPEMKLDWGTYPNQIGHDNEHGCFRCHDESHATASGATISMDCETCHLILAEEEKDPAILKTLSGK
jgi:hypothetical protein